MKLIPLGDKVVLKQVEAEETTASGIILQAKTQEKPLEGIVVAVGPGGIVDGKEITMQVKEGDKVVFLHRREKDVVVYLMHTIAVGDEHASNFLGVLERWIDDCTYFVFTNIKGPIVVAPEKIAFLSLEGLDFKQPEQFVSELASVRLWDLFEI